jgi:hypothetical protein
MKTKREEEFRPDEKKKKNSGKMRGEGRTQVKLEEKEIRLNEKRKKHLDQMRRGRRIQIK